MNERLEKIRQLRSELEEELEAGAVSVGDRDFSALELPLIIQEIVDDLQPLLSPYEAAFYWYAFRHSIAKNGNPYVRLSGKALRRGCVKSSYSTTLYRVLIPDEVEACRKFRAERTAMEPTPELAAADIDYYNIRENHLKVYERDAYKCHYCDKQLTRFTATLDHITPVAEGGNNSYENIEISDPWNATKDIQNFLDNGSGGRQ